MDYYTSVSRYGNQLFIAGYEDGKKVLRKEKYEPTLYIKTNKKNTPYQTIHGNLLEAIPQDSMGEASNFVKQRVGTNQEVYGITNYIFQWIVENFPNGISGVTSKNLNICTFDLEMMSDSGFPTPEEAAFPIVSGAFHFSRSGKTVVFGLKDGYVSDNPSTTYIKCSSEIHLLRHIISLFQSGTIDICTGWNTRLFDIPYLRNRIEKVLGEKESNKLSSFGKVFQNSIYIKGKEHIVYDIFGISQLDYLDLFKKFALNTFKQMENYRLDTIGNVVLGQRKLDYSEYSNLNELYEKDFQKFIEYNIRDTHLVRDLENQVKYIDIAISLGYMTGTNFIDSLGTIAVWDAYIYRELLKRGQIVPPNKEADAVKFEGAYVKEPIPGKYDWIVSFDLASLYPNIIIQYNLSPETIVNKERLDIDGKNGVDKLLSGNLVNPLPMKYSMTANGVYFTKEKQGILPELVEKVYNERKQKKQEMIQYQKELEKTSDKKKQVFLKNQIDIAKNHQMALKIFLNSCYGATGNRFFRLFDIRIAEGITTTGQLSTKWAEKTVNAHLNKLMKTDGIDYVIYGDTDSIYIDLSSVVEKFQPKNPVDFLDQLGKQSIEPAIARGYEELFGIMGGFKPRMEMEREKICDHGIWTGKKHYIVRVLDNEGVRYKKPKISITGIEAVKSSTPKVIRDRLKESFEIILEGDNEKTKQFLNETKEYFMKCSPEEIAFPRGISELTKWKDSSTIYSKGTPIHCRGALLFNHFVKKHGLEHLYPSIKDGDKMLFVYLRTPNPVRENVIGFTDILPKEFELHEYIDYETQYEKTFLNVIEPILKIIGWQNILQQEESLSAFFS